jgi:hypothetical protein
MQRKWDDWGSMKSQIARMKAEMAAPKGTMVVTDEQEDDFSDLNSCEALQVLDGVRTVEEIRAEKAAGLLLGAGI